MTVATATQPIEGWIAEYGLQYKNVTLELGDINMEASLRNQARVGEPLNVDQVALYAAAMEEGTVFPPLVVYRSKQRSDRKYIVVDGNHRVAAAGSAGKGTLDAYEVIEPSDMQITLMTFEANTRHGLPTSIEERVRQAATLVEYGATQAAAARKLGIPVNRLNDSLKVVRSDRRAMSLGLPKAWFNLPISSRTALGGLQNDNAFIETAKLVMEASIGSHQVHALVTRVSRATTEGGALAIVADERKLLNKEIRVTAGGKIQLAPRVRSLNWALGRINRFDVKADLHNVNLPKELRTTLLERIGDAETKLQTIRDGLSES